jgi:hypothetical protein
MVLVYLNRDDNASGYGMVSLSEGVSIAFVFNAHK